VESQDKDRTVEDILQDMAVDLVVLVVEKTCKGSNFEAGSWALSLQIVGK